MKKNNGITLVSLVITIVLLLILSGITLSSVFSDSGIISKALEADFKTNIQQINENLQLSILEQQLKDYNFDSSTLNGYLKNVLGENTLYKKYTKKLYIHNGEMVYIGDNSKEKKWAKQIGIKLLNLHSDEDRLTLNIAKSKDSALANNQITKYQYTYQINGDLKDKIENKLGRPIDYSIDRFYEVKYTNILSDIDEGKTFIYNDNSGIVVEVTEKTKKNIGAWFWKGTSELDVAIMQDATVQDEFFEKLKNYDISQIYLSLSPEHLAGNTKVENFVANAYNRNIKIYLAVGKTNYLDADVKDKTIYTFYDKLQEYNASVTYDKRIAGINYDAEVWLNYDWKNDIAIRNKHIQYIKDMRTYSQEKNLETVFTLPFWIVQHSYTDTNGNSINMFDEITKTLEEVNLMLYRDSSQSINALVSNVQNNAQKPLYQYCVENECNLNIAVEADLTDEGDYITFYEEESENPGCVIEALHTLQSLYSSKWDNFSFSIHHASILIKILGGINGII